MVQSKRYRGVRQRQWGSWVSEIRHPLLKKRVWLGTFETPEAAARAYDQASILMNGHNAKTNFPTAKTLPGDAAFEVSQLLTRKLRKSCKEPSPSLTCLRLDTDNSHIGVWQKRAGSCSGSNWVMRVELGKKDDPQQIGLQDNVYEDGNGMTEEDRVALQMIEELLNCPTVDEVA